MSYKPTGNQEKKRAAKEHNEKRERRKKEAVQRAEDGVNPFDTHDSLTSRVLLRAMTFNSRH